MKRRLNILCGLIFVALAGLVVNAFTDTFDFHSKVEHTAETAKKPIKVDVDFDLSTSIDLSSKTTGEKVFADSLFNTHNEKWMPARINQIQVSVGGNQTESWVSYLLFALNTVSCTLFIVIVIYFIKLVRNIHKGIIFDWLNVRYFRRLGYVLVSLFVFSSLCWNLIMQYLASLTISFENYTVSFSIDYMYLILGIVSLLFAEIFAIGLKMKEDQDLTI